MDIDFLWLRWYFKLFQINRTARNINSLIKGWGAAVIKGWYYRNCVDDSESQLIPFMGWPGITYRRQSNHDFADYVPQKIPDNLYRHGTTVKQWFDFLRNRWLFKSSAELPISYVLLPQMLCAMLKPIGCSDNKTALARKYFSDYAPAPKEHDYFSHGVRLKRGSPTINWNAACDLWYVHSGFFRYWYIVPSNVS